MKPNTILSTLLFLLWGFYGLAQVPTSNLYLIDYLRSPNGSYKFDHPSFLTYDNKNSYNNQPYFLGEELYYTGIRDGEQTDIFKCNVGKRTRTQMTNTPESEYSPKVTPDGEHFSVVRVTADSLKKQQLWRYKFDGKETPELLTKDLTNVGYYEWIKEHLIVFFLVGEPHRLELHNLKTDNVKILKRDIGRCFVATSNNTLIFVDKRDEKTWTIKEINLGTLLIRSIIDTPEGVEDFVVAPTGEILMGKGASLFKYMPKKDYDWIEIGDFSQYGISNIKRLAIDGDQIAICDVEK